MAKNLEIPHLYLSELSLSSRKHLVDAINFCGMLMKDWPWKDMPGRQIFHYLPKRLRENSYIEFDIPKKSGGLRHISAPTDELLLIQQALNTLLQSICEVSNYAMGFTPGRSVRNNAEIHCGQKVVFNCDLQNFFPSITKEMVRKTLTRELLPCHASREVTNAICSLVTVPREDGVEALPQGAPTSPTISNLVLKPLDRRLGQYAYANGYRYSRYADDITFSHSHVDCKMYSHKIDTIFSIIQEYGLTVNQKKTKVYTRKERMEVTGLTVGEKVNVSRKYVKQLRVLLHLWETRGYAETEEIYNRDFAKGIDTNLASVVHGKLNYLQMIKGKEDSTCSRLNIRFRKLINELKQEEI